MTFGIKPSRATLAKPIDLRSRFDYVATPGATQSDYVAVSNDAPTPITLSIYASDGFNTDSDGFDLLVAGKPSVDIGSWITLKTNKVSVPARSAVVVPFTLRVPLKATPGDHVGGIVVSLPTVETDKKGNRITVEHRVGVRVYLRLQGPLDPALAVAGLTAKFHGSLWNPFARGKVTVSYTLRNPGNVLLGARQSVWVAGSYGGTVRAAPILDVTELLPDNIHQEQVVISGVRPAFHEKATVSVVPLALQGGVDGQLTTVVATTAIWAIPWALLVFVLVVLAGTGFCYHVWHRRRSPDVAGPAKAGQPAAGQRRSVGVKP